MFSFLLYKYIEVGITEMYGIMGFIVSPLNSYGEVLTQCFTMHLYLE